jgi:hypothetical protein
MARRTPAARALVGALALRDGATTNQAFKLAGYGLIIASPETSNHSARLVMRRNHIVFRSRNAFIASAWLLKLGQKLESLGVGKVAA